MDKKAWQELADNKADTILDMSTQIDILNRKIVALQNALIDIVNDYQDLQEYGKFAQVSHHISQASINRAKDVLGIELTNTSFIHRDDIK